MDKDIEKYVGVYLEFVESPDSTEEVSPEPQKFVEKSANPDQKIPDGEQIHQMLDDLSSHMDDVLANIKSEVEEAEKEDNEEQEEAEVADIACPSLGSDEEDIPTEDSVLTFIMDDNPIMDILGLGDR
jgi:hypothetical protein